MSRNTPGNDKRFFFIREGSRHHRIDFDGIRYLEARKSYCRINTISKVWLVPVGISQLEKILPPDDFCRIHRSYIVCLAHIEWFENSVLRTAGQDLPVGDSYRGRLRRKVVMVPGETSQTPARRTAKAMVLA